MNKRFLVAVQSYSLEAGKVGQDVRTEYVFPHSTAKAALRSLGSLIAGKRKHYGQVARRGRRLFVRDTSNGNTYSYRQVQQLIALEAE